MHVALRDVPSPRRTRDRVDLESEAPRSLSRMLPGDWTSGVPRASSRADRAGVTIPPATPESHRDRPPAGHRRHGLGAFAIMTWLDRQPDDPPVRCSRSSTPAKGLGQYMPEWRGLSDSANSAADRCRHRHHRVAPVDQAARRGPARLRDPRPRHGGQRAREEVVARPRPPGFDNTYLGAVYSFPSGHVLEAVTIYGIIAVLVWRSSLPTIVRIAVPDRPDRDRRAGRDRPGRGRRALPE